jgi:hypothetical protein
MIERLMTGELIARCAGLRPSATSASEGTTGFWHFPRSWCFTR